MNPDYPAEVAKVACENAVVIQREFGSYPEGRAAVNVLTIAADLITGLDERCRALDAGALPRRARIAELEEENTHLREHIKQLRAGEVPLPDGSYLQKETPMDDETKEGALDRVEARLIAKTQRDNGFMGPTEAAALKALGDLYVGLCIREFCDWQTGRKR